MQKKSKEEIDQISTILIKELTDKSELNIKRIILYGSYARGEADDYSDMDVLPFYQNVIKEGVVLYE